MTNGFGFSFPTSGNGDDDDDRNPNGRGGGPGGLGDMLNQFGQMLSGMGSSMNNSNDDSPVNYDMAKRIAGQQIKSASKISTQDTTAVEEAARLAELWLDDATDLPTANNRIAAWNAEDWLQQTIPMWKRFVDPVAKHMNEAQLESMPEEARQMMGPMSNMMSQLSGMNFGMQLGHALGDLAKQALTGSDFGLPVAPSGTTAVLPHNIQSIARDLNVKGQEVLVYIAAREVARQRLFKHVPWLSERLVSSVEEYAVGLVIGTSHIEEAARDLNLESGDPQSIQDAMQNLQGMDLSPRITSRNTAAVARLETLLALIEGWVEFVVGEALQDRIPSTQDMAEAWRRRRASGGSAEQAFEKVVGIELSAPRVSDAAELWRRSTVAVGVDRRDSVWEHPDFLPQPEHLDNPAAFIDGLLDESGDQEFEAEFAKLEEMLRGEGSSEGNGDGDGEAGGEGGSENTGTDADSHDSGDSDDER
ncbi:zinc-dependent metalloprotease [Corynebacterium propinquum]|uniref:zinc-dependent metalloprotease n=1 Tax=Corynebacterium propinquum TaxID=43769 RepID=UPI0026703F67|nr:zinc-dependent metalloprotease [Corynebacterium propinquum]WKS32965.1 zinc-dependent metalloprotease [Corynebacterium propinquum]WKS35445.1 zinc-dependent metalloprotease [Corynebacterium propinquum]WKS39332.1 zinc-dependent metalloprotease [Corynebacterium propinquum]WKS43556.1 zinc-dependent metalloprotease [Corynebacterium propinquum]WKS47728.1 zinc-dependent metalloprotease [Corynebacterium propinquum]